MNEDKTVSKNGRPWDIIGKFHDFEGADILRQGVLKESGGTLAVKVKKLKNEFVVKARAAPVAKREKKTKLNKKQRKKNYEE